MHLNPEGISPKGSAKKEDDKVYTKLSSISKRLHVLYDLFTRDSYFTVVLNDDTLSFTETIRIREELGKLDIPINSLCINKIRSSSDSSRIRKEFSGCPLFYSKYIPEELSSINQLHKISIEELVGSFLGS